MQVGILKMIYLQNECTKSKIIKEFISSFCFLYMKKQNIQKMQILAIIVWTLSKRPLRRGVMFVILSVLEETLLHFIQCLITIFNYNILQNRELSTSKVATILQAPRFQVIFPLVIRRNYKPNVQPSTGERRKPAVKRLRKMEKTSRSSHPLGFLSLAAYAWSFGFWYKMVMQFRDREEDCKCYNNNCAVLPTHCNKVLVNRVI